MVHTELCRILKELTGQKIKLTVTQQEEWIPYFEDQSSKAASLQELIATTEKEADKIVLPALWNNSRRDHNCIWELRYGIRGTSKTIEPLND